MVNLEDLTNRYFCNGFDVPYELKCGQTLNIKPILVKDYPYYEFAKSVLEIKKNETDNIQVIQMSYLEFLINIVCATNEELKNSLLMICKLCLGYNKIATSIQNDKLCLCLCNDNEEVEKIINRKEFDDIIKIILNQNDSSYDNRYISPEVRELMQTYYKVKYSSTYSPTLEEKKAFVSSKIGILNKELNEITYREFDMIYNSAVNSEIYIGQKIIQGSYKYEVKDDIKHPLFTPKHDPYSDIFEDTSILTQKGINGAEQLEAQNIQLNKQ